MTNFIMTLFRTLRSLLYGRKTYLVAIVAGGVIVAGYLGWLTVEQVQLALQFLGVGGVITFRAALNK